MSDKKINDGGPAFEEGYQGFADAPAKESKYHIGMTLRDYFAAKAMLGILSGDRKICPEEYKFTKPTPENTALVAYIFADEMIKARGNYE